jgi:hypothetical protein
MFSANGAPYLLTGCAVCKNKVWDESGLRLELNVTHSNAIT